MTAALCTQQPTVRRPDVHEQVTASKNNTRKIIIEFSPQYIDTNVYTLGI